MIEEEKRKAWEQAIKNKQWKSFDDVLYHIKDTAQEFGVTPTMLHDIFLSGLISAQVFKIIEVPKA